MESDLQCENDLSLMTTELRLGLSEHAETSSERKISSGNKKRPVFNTMEHSDRVKMVGWPPISWSHKKPFRPKNAEPETGKIYVKVSMDGLSYMRNIDLKLYDDYPDLLVALKNMLIDDMQKEKEYKESEYVPTYEDKDGDWMLIGDVPWETFISSCKRLRIMKQS